MKKLFSIAALLVGTLLIMAANAQAAAKKVDVIFFHDLHSNFQSFSLTREGQTIEAGGFARIKTVIDNAWEENPNTLVLDGGDFSMGTLFQTVYAKQATELRMLGALGVDATTLGNHEFDYRSQGLADMLTAARISGESLPELVVCNAGRAPQSEGGQIVEAAFDAYGVKDYVMLEKGGVNIAVLGVFGIDALICSPTCEVEFADPIQAARETVDIILANEDADLIVALSHSGTDPDPEDSEDELLAKAVPELDLIVSGHTHTRLDQPIVSGSTYIVSSGEYGQQIGSLSLVQGEDGSWQINDYRLIPITTDIEEDEEILQKIEEFSRQVDEEYLSSFGYSADQVLATNTVEMSTVSQVYSEHREHNLGSLISDAFVYAASRALGEGSVDVGVAPSGCIRASLALGEITVEDAFNTYSLGIGADGVPGYPLLLVYLTGAELKTAAEVDASVSDIMTSARLYTSGLQFSYNPHRLILNKVTDVYLNKDGQRVELEDDKLYAVVTDLYSGQMLGAVTDVSYGLLKIEPKNADGSPIESLESCIIHENGQELKAWQSVADYIASFSDEGDGQIPLSYGQTQGRKVVEDSRNLVDLMKNPNKYALMICGVVILVLVIIALPVVLIIRAGKRRRARKGS